MITTNGRGPGPARPSRRTLLIAGGIGAGVIVAAAAIGIVLALEGVGVPSRAQPLPGLLTGPAPWGPNTDDLRARLDRLGLPLTPSVGLPSSFVHLRLVVNRRRIQIPRGIGIPPKSGSVAPLFGGGPSGGILRAPLSKVVPHLGLLFKIWGLRFTKHCLGGDCGKLSVFVNGGRVPGNPRSLLLRSGQKIVVSVQR